MSAHASHPNHPRRMCSSLLTGLRVYLDREIETISRTVRAGINRTPLRGEPRPRMGLKGRDRRYVTLQAEVRYRAPSSSVRIVERPPSTPITDFHIRLPRRCPNPMRLLGKRCIRLAKKRLSKPGASRSSTRKPSGLGSAGYSTEFGWAVIREDGSVKSGSA